MRLNLVLIYWCVGGWNSDRPLAEAVELEARASENRVKEYTCSSSHCDSSHNLIDEQAVVVMLYLLRFATHFLEIF